MNLRQLIQADRGWLDAPSPRRVLWVAFTACAGLAVYGFTVGYWRDPVMGGYVAVKLPLLVALTLLCNGLLNGLLGLLLGTGLGFRQSLLALLTAFALAGVILGSLAPATLLLAWNAPPPDSPGARHAHAAYLLTHIFATLAGARVSISQLAACLAAALALAGLLLLGFAPAVWIFAESTDSFGFMGALAVGAWLIAVGFALRFLKSVIFATGGTQKGPLMIWSVVFLLVTLQMTTSLRPILGRSDTRLTQEKKFFLQHWGDTFGEMLVPQAARMTVKDRPEPDVNPASPEAAPTPGAGNSRANP